MIARPPKVKQAQVLMPGGGFMASPESEAAIFILRNTIFQFHLLLLYQPGRLAWESIIRPAAPGRNQWPCPS
jgi:hypothetical protein